MGEVFRAGYSFFDSSRLVYFPGGQQRFASTLKWMDRSIERADPEHLHAAFSGVFSKGLGKIA